MTNLTRHPLLLLCISLSLLAMSMPTPVAAADLIDAPVAQPSTHQPVSKLDWALLAGDTFARGLDVYSTHWALAQGDHEMVLPDFIAHHVPAMTAFSMGIVAFDWYSMRYLERHHHPRLGHCLTIIDGTQDGYAAIHNLTLPPVPRWPPSLFPPTHRTGGAR